MNNVLELEGPLPVRYISNKSNSFIEKSRPLLPAISDDTKVFHIAELVIEASKALGQTLRVLFPIRPFRSLPQRYYIPTGRNPGMLDIGGTCFRIYSMVILNWLSKQMNG